MGLYKKGMIMLISSMFLQGCSYCSPYLVYKISGIQEEERKKEDRREQWVQYSENEKNLRAEAEIKSVITTFIDVCQSMDYTGLESCCEGFDVLKARGNLSLVEDKELDTELVAWVYSYLYQNIFLEYSVDSIDVQGDTAVCRLKVDGIADLVKLAEEVTVAGFKDDLLSEIAYQVESVEDESERESKTREIVKDRYKRVLTEQAKGTVFYIVNVSKISGKWKVVSMLSESGNTIELQ